MMMTDSIGCLSEDDEMQIAHGSMSHDTLTTYFANQTGVLAEETLSNLTAFRVKMEHREDEEDKWKDTVWIDNARSNGDIVQLHYQHSYTCNETDYNPMSMLWLVSAAT